MDHNNHVVCLRRVLLTTFSCLLRAYQISLLSLGFGRLDDGFIEPSGLSQEGSIR